MSGWNEPSHKICIYCLHGSKTKKNLLSVEIGFKGIHTAMYVVNKHPHTRLWKLTYYVYKVIICINAIEYKTFS